MNNIKFIAYVLKPFSAELWERYRHRFTVLEKSSQCVQYISKVSLICTIFYSSYSYSQSLLFLNWYMAIPHGNNWVYYVVGTLCTKHYQNNWISFPFNLNFDFTRSECSELNGFFRFRTPVK